METTIAHKILIVDDDQIIHGVIKAALERTGQFDFLHAYDGREGILAYEVHEPSLTLLDIDMPLMSGLEVLNGLDSKKKIKCPIIAMSGRASMEELDQCIENGAWMFMGKPFQIEMLTKSVDYLLKSASPQ